MGDSNAEFGKKNDDKIMSHFPSFTIIIIYGLRTYIQYVVI